jgi:hypothetical protein
VKIFGLSVALMIREKCAQLECDGIARRMWADHADIETRGMIPCDCFYGAAA